MLDSLSHVSCPSKQSPRDARTVSHPVQHIHTFNLIGAFLSRARACVCAHEQSDYKSLISYYLREGLYQHAADEASEQIRRRGNDAYLLYWKGKVRRALIH